MLRWCSVGLLPCTVGRFAQIQVKMLPWSELDHFAQAKRRDISNVPALSLTCRGQAWKP